MSPGLCRLLHFCWSPNVGTSISRLTPMLILQKDLPWSLINTWLQSVQVLQLLKTARIANWILISSTPEDFSIASLILSTGALLVSMLGYLLPSLTTSTSLGVCDPSCHTSDIDPSISCYHKLTNMQSPPNPQLHPHSKAPLMVTMRLLTRSISPRLSGLHAEHRLHLILTRKWDCQVLILQRGEWLLMIVLMVRSALLLVCSGRSVRYSFWLGNFCFLIYDLVSIFN